MDKPLQITDRKEQVLRTKTIPLVKVLWQHGNIEEFTWELEAEMREKYPELFSDSGMLNFEDEIIFRRVDYDTLYFSSNYNYIIYIYIIHINIIVLVVRIDLNYFSLRWRDVITN